MNFHQKKKQKRKTVSPYRKQLYESADELNILWDVTRSRVSARKSH